MPTNMTLEPPTTPLKCFLLEPVDKVRAYCRRYSTYTPGNARDPRYYCGVDGRDYHNAEQHIGDLYPMMVPELDDILPEDPRWPTRCWCGHVFTDADAYDIIQKDLYRRSDTGEIVEGLVGAPAGAVYRATWMESRNYPKGPDGCIYLCVLPDGHVWNIDSRSSNCSSPADTQHRCWLRHGQAPEFSVDKTGGQTCNAGAGSIQSPKGWHGFLTNGFLTTA